VVKVSTESGPVFTKVEAGIVGGASTGAAACGATKGAGSSARGRRVTTVPVGVCRTVVSTGSGATERLITVWACAAEDASARAKADAASLRDAFINASNLLGWTLNVRQTLRVSLFRQFRRDHFASQM
jgi:hypothetical protein